MAEENAASSGNVGLAELLGPAEPIVQDTTPGAGTVVEEGPAETGDELEIEPGGESGEEAEAEGEAESLEPSEDERDYADAVYERYAKQFETQWKLKTPLNLEDEATRNMLREIIQRGENFKNLQREADEARTAAETEEEPEHTEDRQQQPAAETPEQVKVFLESVDKFSEQRVRPEVAKVFLSDFLGSLWGDKGRKMAETADPSAAKAFTKTMVKFGYLFLNDALPEILKQNVPNLVNETYPGLSETLKDNVYEQALELVASEHPDIAELVDSEAFDEVYKAQPWLRNAEFSKNPVENEAKRLQVAMSFLQGGRRTETAPEQLERAAEQGRRQARRAETSRGTGRLAPGESRGEFGNVDPADQLITSLAKSGDRDRSVQDMLAPRK